MKTLQKSIAVGAGSMLVLAGMGATALAQEQPTVNASDAAVAAEAGQTTTAGSNLVKSDKVNGIFTFTQEQVDSTDDIQKNLGTAPKYLCGANATEAGESVPLEDWAIEVKGDVGNAFTATYDELAEEYEAHAVVMGCACAGNPSDGAASANALVKGIPVLTLLEMSDPSVEANTVVFTSTDGYEVALPMSYLVQKYCPLVFDVNGAPLAESIGGTNQLWLGSTAASYFARDVVAISVEHRDTPPPSPSSDEARASYVNVPNIGVVFGGEVE